MQKNIQITSWIGHGFDRLRADTKPPKDPKSEYTIYLAKGETEGCHIGIYTENDVEKLRFELISGKNEHIKFASYHVVPILELDGKTYTDPAVPFDGEDFSLEGAKTFALLLEFTTDESTPAGDYLYEFGITDPSGAVISKKSITVHVWNFAMPKEKNFQRTVNVGITVNPGMDNFKMLLEHNMNTRFLPVSIMSDEADEYLSDPRITCFLIPRGISDEGLTAIYEKLKSNPKWIKKAFFYPIDEPRTVQMVKDLEEMHKRLKALCPEIMILSPYYTNVQMDEATDQIAYMSSFMTAHCPKLANWDDDQIYTEGQREKFGPAASRMKALKERGDTVWAYVCNYPLAPYLNIKVDDEGIGSRVLFWQMYQRNIDGFLYWNAAYYERLPEKSPWNSVDTFGNGIYGDGILLYPGDKVGVSGPIASIRLKIMRDGLDDIELFYLAERLLGKEWIDERVNKASSSLTSVDVTSDELYCIRIEIGDAVEKKLNGN